jgi:phage terminase small subunit
MSHPKLTLKQEAFAQTYIETGNASEAYRRSYSTLRFKSTSIEVNASKMLNHAKVSLRIAELRQALAKRNEITEDKIIQEYAKIAFADMSTYAKWGAHGVDMTDSSELSAEQTAAISEVTGTRTDKGSAVKFKLHDKKGALDSLAKILGYDKADPRGEQPIQITRVTVVLPPGHEPPVIEGESYIADSS